MATTIFKHLVIVLLMLALTGCTANTPPTINNILVSPAVTVKAGDTAQLNAIVTDKEKDAVIYYWTANSGTVPGGPQGATVVYTAPLSGGFDYVTVEVSDGVNTSSSTVSISVVSSNDPVLTIAPELPTAEPTIIIQVSTQPASEQSEATATAFVPTNTPIPPIASPTNVFVAEPTNTLVATPTPHIVASSTPTSECSNIIALQSDRDDDWEIYVLNIDTKVISQLTVNSNFDTGPSWSPDGTKIAFESNRDGNWEIYMMNADGSMQERLTYNSSGTDLAPSWSPDGTKIVFQSSASGINQIHVIDINSKIEYQLTSNSYQKYAPVWSPDGTKIAYFTRRDNLTHISIFDLASSSETFLRGTGLGDSDPQWSWDGSKILFVSQKDIYMMDINGSHATILERHGSVDHYPVWDQCMRIAFETDRGTHSPNPQQYDIYLKDSSGFVRSITNENSNEGQPSWKP